MTTSFHRTILDYVNALTRYGLVVTKLDEPLPFEEWKKLLPSIQKNFRILPSIVIEAIKIT